MTRILPWLLSFPFVALIAISIAVWLTGCGSDWQSMNCRPGIEVSLITWDRVSNANEKCREIGAVENAIACAQFVNVGDATTMGLIVSTEDVEDRILGHEFRHAYGCSHVK